MKFLVLSLVALLPLSAVAPKLDQHAGKLATLGTRGANPRIQKAVALLEAARLDGWEVSAGGANPYKTLLKK